jgi:hypothetical protein
MRFVTYVAALFVLAPLSVGATAGVLVSSNTTWNYFKGRSAPAGADALAWTRVGYNDSSWASGAAPFSYGEAEFSGTKLSDMQNQYSAVFLRKSFQVAQPGTIVGLQLETICDDGYVIWLNGRRIADYNAPADPVGFNAFATVNAAEPVAWVATELPGAQQFLVAGQNVLAVQALNVNLSSSDLVFDVQLAGLEPVSAAPTIARIDPPPGLVSNLTEVVVTFSELIVGLRAEDLLINGEPSAAMSGGGAVYRFRFSPPPFGSVQFSWSTFHEIRDLDEPPHRFELGAPSASWVYELIDPAGPQVLRVLPPPGSTVRRLSEMEVWFDKAVAGLEAADLLLAGRPARELTGVGAGPYVFAFEPVIEGLAQVTWSAAHGVTSDAAVARPLQVSEWHYNVDPALPLPPVVISELMAENYGVYRDEDQDPEDWIELYNPGPTAVNLSGWSLSDKRDDPGRWVFPEISLPARGYLTVFASAKDRTMVGGTARLHTNFKLNVNSGYVGLFGLELPRVAVSEVEYPLQAPDYSYGRESGTGAWRHFKGGTPLRANGQSMIDGGTESVAFSVKRGFFSRPFNLVLSCPTLGAQVRYTLDGSAPSETNGLFYLAPIPIMASRVVRAAAFGVNRLPSPVITHTYLMDLPATRTRLPALSLVTASNHLFGTTGIMEYSPRNTTKHGAAWERPISAEWIGFEDNAGFQVDCGIRVQGGGYIRGRYNYRSSSLPESKYSFRLYFRGEYGQGRLKYPLFPDTTVSSFDTIVLRAGMNDHTNPFLIDELVRQLAGDCGQPAARGTFVNLFLNGVYKGYYNVCERIDTDFLRAYHGGGEKWDIIAMSGEVREGDASAWNALRTFANTRDLNQLTNYLEISRRLDLTNFVDYLLPLIYVDNDDWPHNNWRAARERIPESPFRFYVWDSEFAFGFVTGHSPSWNTINNQLSSTSPPWGGTEIQRLFNSLKRVPEFRLLFADRVHRHLFNGGALTDERIRGRYDALRSVLTNTITGFNNRIGTTWIPQRRRYVLDHLRLAGFLASSNAPVFSQSSGRVPAGYALEMSRLAGTIYYTTNGTDPRVPFSGEPSREALAYAAPLRLAAPLEIKARTLDGTNWSALTEAVFQVDSLGLPVRITEIMYHPVGGEGFEFIELTNVGAVPVDLSGCSFQGVDFRFPEPFPPLAPGARLILASGAAPALFGARYPDLQPAGYYGGALSNGGERLALMDRSGRTIESVDYRDDDGWDSRADGLGHSLVRLELDGDPDDPTQWSASAATGGSPGQAEPEQNPPPVVLNEVMFRTADAASGAVRETGWIEVANRGAEPVDLSGWRILWSGGRQATGFGPGLVIPPGGYEVLRPGDAATLFPLPTGDTVWLLDPRSNRVDAVRYGPQVPGYSLGRHPLGGEWTLTEPTPRGLNELAQIAGAHQVRLNEWLANPAPGDDDWVELHNLDADHPAWLDGWHLGTLHALHQLRSLIAIPPGGFLRLWANEQPGPVHLDFKLPASGNSIILYDPSGNEMDRVQYGPQASGISLGRLPDGVGPVITFPGTSSPGASNYVASLPGPRLNEFMARASAARDPSAPWSADYVELYNPESSAYLLDGVTLEVEAGKRSAWSFPAGIVFPPRGLLVVHCDPQQKPSAAANVRLETGFGLPGEGATLRLRNAAGEVLDSLTYGFQLFNEACGRVGTNWALLSQASPGRPNGSAARLGEVSGVRLNEWRAVASAGEDDWIEVFNPAPYPVNLAGLFLTDDPSVAGQTKFQIASLSLIAANGFAVWKADGNTESGPDHVNFRLNRTGEILSLLRTNRVLIDSLDLVAESGVGSAGRWPDGAAQLTRFATSASPGAPNWLPLPDLVINEMLTHSDPPQEDALELWNGSAVQRSVGGWCLSDDPLDWNKYRIPDGTVVPAGAYAVFYEHQWIAGAATGATLRLDAESGGTVWLTATDSSGQPTGYRATARFGAAPNGWSFVRHPTSAGTDYPLTATPSFGAPNGASLTEFRQGGGASNAPPLIGPVVITEVKAVTGNEAAARGLAPAELEYLEFANLNLSTVPLHDGAHPANAWRLRGDVDFEWPAGFTLQGAEMILLVGFDPADAQAAVRFRQLNGVAPAVRLLGPWRGGLRKDRVRLRLECPDSPNRDPLTGTLSIPYFVTEALDFPRPPAWTQSDSTTAASVQRRSAPGYGNEPLNWMLAEPTPGQGPPSSGTDSDRDGIPDAWELEHGLDPTRPDDAWLDADGDGLYNLTEFELGSDPNDAQSGLRVSALIGGDGLLRLILHTPREHSFMLYVREAWESGRWMPWGHIPAVATNRVLEITDPVPAARLPMRYYRVVTPAEP